MDMDGCFLNLYEKTLKTKRMTDFSAGTLMQIQHERFPNFIRNHPDTNVFLRSNKISHKDVLVLLNISHSTYWDCAVGCFLTHDGIVFAATKYFIEI